MSDWQMRILKYYFVCQSEQLDANERTMLLRWLTEQQVKFNYIGRDFTDAVQVAELLAKLYPQLVDLNNYPKSSNSAVKLSNWKTLNFKVLSRLNLKLPKQLVKLMVAGDGTVTELFLYDLMQHESKRKYLESKAVKDQEQIWVDNNDVMDIDLNVKVGDGIVKVPQKMILYSLYEEAEREKCAKELQLEELKNQINDFEEQLAEKNKCIEELVKKRAKLSYIDNKLNEAGDKQAQHK